MTLGIDGLVSGLDTTSLINSLMQVEAVPQTLLKNQATAAQTVVSALQGLNSKVADLTTLATTAAAPGALDLYSAKSSSSAVTATATAGASTGSIDVVVNQIAQAQVSVTAAMTTWPDSTGFTITSGGNTTTISPASASLDDVVSAINSSAAGVRAVKVAAGTDSTGAAQYRLQLTSTTIGAAGAFSLSDMTPTEVQTAQDAQVTLWAGTGAQQVVTSPTNTFSNLLPGVAVTVSAASASPVTITVAHDDAQVSSIASNLVSALNGVFALVATQSAVNTSTNSSGVSATTSGPFTGDSTVQDVNQQLLSAASMPVNGHSPSEIGISITKDGNLTFDAAKFSAALAADPAGTQATLQTIASRVQAAGSSASDQYSGRITAEITGQQSLLTDMNSQIADWDTRLADRRASLEQTYANLETQLGKLKSQSSWLSSQLSSLPSTSTTTNSGA